MQKLLSLLNLGSRKSNPFEKKVHQEIPVESCPTDTKHIEPIPLNPMIEEDLDCTYELAHSDDESGISTLSTNDQRTVEYQTLEPEQIISKQQVEILDVANTLCVSITCAGLLLRFYRWNKEKLFNEYFIKDNVCKLAGIDLTTSTHIGVLNEMECGICFDDKAGSEMMALDCKHYVCLGCWKKYISVAISEGPSQCLSLKCPMKCNLKVTEEIVNASVPQDLKDRYNQFLTRSFVDDNPLIKWCPRPGCGRSVLCDDHGMKDVTCSCGFSFCFKCSHESHAPCSCEDLKLWNLKSSDDSETSHYLLVNTKDCPSCKRGIEKNGGCNHMVCTFCKFEWCWVCNEDWKKYHSAQSNSGGFYHCNRYQPEELEKRAKKDVESARIALEKYMHYYQRFANHQMSQKLENRINHMYRNRKDLKDKSLVDVEYLEKAIDQLVNCRSVLKNTYVFAYYMKDGPEKNLFEYLQEDLEKNTEELSRLLENPNGYHREDIQSVTKLAKTRLTHLLKGIECGFI